MLQSDANLIELDLLRGGRRILPEPALEALIQETEPPPAYVVFARVNRAWRRHRGVAAYFTSFR